jgi:hypothetical protein
MVVKITKTTTPTEGGNPEKDPAQIASQGELSQEDGDTPHEASEQDSPDEQEPEQLDTPAAKKRKVSRKKAKPYSKDENLLKKINKTAEKVQRFHAMSDDELLDGIKVKPEREERLTYKLDSEQLDMRLALLHRLLIRKVNPADIRKQLGLEQKMYEYLRRKLDDKMRLDITRLDVPYMIGDSLSLYEEVRSMALTVSSSNTVKDARIKLAAMTIALKAESDKNNFLARCGVYGPEVVQYLVKGMIATGTVVEMSGPSTARTKDVDEMVGELLNVLQLPAGVQSIANEDFEIRADS